ncbi:MAG: tRNA epoxyqueuosine(34) reductase QueG [Kiloniellales bacterium]|nr:tRNA epoxyqueuosine(34) reductase QueG [Kiloniellales bacterium]
MKSMDSPKEQKNDIKGAIRNKALALGFDLVGFAPATSSEKARSGLKEYLNRGYHGDMGWMANTFERRQDPQELWSQAKSIVVLGVNYGPKSDPMANLCEKDRAVISCYAQNRDYHDQIKKKLKALARWIVSEFPSELKVFVDTAPVMEKHLAQRAGLGWQGKHTNLVSRSHGSWLFLGEIYSTLHLRPDREESDYCGRCRRCLDICPTKAFPQSYLLDARRCISYLTIELKDQIPREFRRAMGNRIYGCDDCLAVCPWNKFATPTRDPAYLARAELTAPRLADLAALDEKSFRAVFSGSPIKRIGRDRFVRNVLVAIGNSGHPKLAKSAETLLSDPSSLVRGMAVWALSRLLDKNRIMELKAQYMPAETEPLVLEEWREATIANKPKGP